MNAPLADEEMSPKRIAADIASELREHPEHWYSGQMAADAEGNELEEYDAPGAVCWCIDNA
jgi:hypothetical protein